MHSSRTNKWHRSIAIRLPPSVPQLLVTNATQLVLLDQKKRNSTQLTASYSSPPGSCRPAAPRSHRRSGAARRSVGNPRNGRPAVRRRPPWFCLLFVCCPLGTETNGKIMAREPPQKKGMWPLHASMPCYRYLLILLDGRRVRERRRIITPIWFEGGSLRY